MQMGHSSWAKLGLVTSLKMRLGVQMSRMCQSCFIRLKMNLECTNMSRVSPNFVIIRLKMKLGCTNRLRSCWKFVIIRLKIKMGCTNMLRVCWHFVICMAAYTPKPCFWSWWPYLTNIPWECSTVHVLYYKNQTKPHTVALGSSS